MSFLSGYLTQRQIVIWSFRRQGDTQAEIGRHLAVQRQGINEALRIIDAKLSQALREAARANKLDIHHVDPFHGILEGYSQAYDVPVVVSFTKSNGVQVWYLYEGRCDRCDRRQACMNLLTAEAEERSISLTTEDCYLPPTQLGKKIFATLTTNMQLGDGHGR
jgi:DNA-binding CsgD family transcriptional regulator